MGQKLCDNCGHPLPNAAGPGLYCTNCGEPVQKPTRVQRRAVERFDARVEGGPADGMRLACERMSDGEVKVLAGALFDDDVAGTMARHYFDTERGVIVYAHPNT